MRSFGICGTSLNLFLDDAEWSKWWGQGPLGEGPVYGILCSVGFAHLERGVTFLRFGDSAVENVEVSTSHSQMLGSDA